jgi:hypothetical protein
VTRQSSVSGRGVSTLRAPALDLAVDLRRTRRRLGPERSRQAEQEGNPCGPARARFHHRAVPGAASLLVISSSSRSLSRRPTRLRISTPPSGSTGRRMTSRRRLPAVRPRTSSRRPCRRLWCHRKLPPSSSNDTPLTSRGTTRCLRHSFFDHVLVPDELQDSVAHTNCVARIQPV